MNAVTYNQTMIGRLWTLADLPGDWPGTAILATADLDKDGDLEADEFPGVEWIRFVEEVREVQILGNLSVDGKLGRDTLDLLRSRFSKAGPANLLVRIGPAEFRRAAVATVEPDRKVQGRTATEQKIASLWNLYGAEIARQAQANDIFPEAALAVFAVEAGGKAYDPKTGLIMIRYEDHVFRRYAGQDCPAQRGGQAAEWDNFRRAADLHLSAAFRATSWGLPQLMGFNHQVTPFDSPVLMAQAFQTSVIHQIGGFFGYIRHYRLDRHVRSGDWRSFVRGYNGPGQVDHYSGVLASYLAAARNLKQQGAFGA